MSKRGALNIALLKEERRRQKIRQADAAAALEIAERHYRRLENGEVEAQGELLEKLVAWAWSELDLPESELVSEVPATSPGEPGSRDPSVPAPASVFVGRAIELAELERRLAEGTRLLTVLGPPGVGKTRLLTEYLRSGIGGWPGGAWFCDLSEARSEEDVLRVVASTLDVRLGQDPVTQLGHALAARGRGLLVLDNFEQVVEHAPLVETWLEQAGEVAFVVTSRVVLQLRGEEMMPLEPLSLEDEAVELFVQRSRARNVDFTLTDDNRDDVQEVVRLLDGLPLAIELAAARSSVLSPKQLRARMKDRFRLLAGARGTKERQATLRAAIDWSWELLEPWEKAALAQVSVFEGGFTLDAAEAVLDLSAWPEHSWPLDAVQSLVDKSLLRTWMPVAVDDRRHDIDEPYFAMYVSIHEYAAEKLRTEGEVSEGGSGSEAEDVVFARHGEYYAGFGTKEAVEALNSHGGAARRRALGRELGNLLTACRRAIKRRQGNTAGMLVDAAANVLLLSGSLRVVLDLGEETLQLQVDPRVRSWVLGTLGVCYQVSDSYELAIERYQAALDMHRVAGDRIEEGRTLSSIAVAFRYRGEFMRARSCLEEALAVFRDVGDKRMEGEVLANLGILCSHDGRYREGMDWHERAIEVNREAGHRRAEAVALGGLAKMSGSIGRFPEAVRLYEAVLEICRELADRRSEVQARANYGRDHFDLGCIETAYRQYELALSLQRELGGRGSEGMLLEQLALWHGARGESEDALSLAGRALRIHCEAGQRRNEAMVLGTLGWLHCDAGAYRDADEYLSKALALSRELGMVELEGEIQGCLGQSLSEQGEFARAGRAFEFGERLIRAQEGKKSLFRLLARRGMHEVRVGRFEQARVCLEELEQSRRLCGVSHSSSIGKAIDELATLLGAEGDS
ncbi:MAG: tetratricopeptide repeat protein [Acidobacteriota bacterium]